MTPECAPRGKVVLEGIGVSKAFGGVQALQGLDFALYGDEILGLIGPNGSGKTTLFNVISGIYPPTSGRVLFNGMPIERLPSHAIAARGIARTFQNVRLFKRLPAETNVMIGAHRRAKAGLVSTMIRGKAFRSAEREAEDAARKWLAYVGLEHRAKEMAQSLPYGEQKLLELARALASGPRVLLLDEPAAGLNQGEVDSLAGVIRNLRSMNIPIFVVEHNMRLVMSVCDRVVAINFGKKIAEGSPQEIQEDAALREAYLGSTGS